MRPSSQTLQSHIIIQHRTSHIAQISHNHISSSDTSNVTNRTRTWCKEIHSDAHDNFMNIRRLLPVCAHAMTSRWLIIDGIACFCIGVGRSYFDSLIFRPMTSPKSMWLNYTMQNTFWKLHHEKLTMKCPSGWWLSVPQLYAASPRPLRSKEILQIPHNLSSISQDTAPCNANNVSMWQRQFECHCMKGYRWILESEQGTGATNQA